MRVVIICLFLVVSCSKVVNIDSKVESSFNGNPVSSISSHYGTSGYKAKAEILNNGIENLDVKLDREKGELAITFDYPKQRWFHAPPYFAERFHVRVFDKNKTLLTHFVTAEKFKVQRYVEKDNSVLPIIPKGNKITYSISQKDVEFARFIEFGFYQENFKIVAEEWFKSN